MPDTCQIAPFFAAQVPSGNELSRATLEEYNSILFFHNICLQHSLPELILKPAQQAPLL